MWSASVNERLNAYFCSRDEPTAHRKESGPSGEDHMANYHQAKLVGYIYLNQSDSCVLHKFFGIEKRTIQSGSKVEVNWNNSCVLMEIIIKLVSQMNFK